MRRLVVTILLAIITAPAWAAAQDKQAAPSSGVNIDAVLNNSRLRLAKGEECFARGELECARREFDEALDSILSLGMDLRAAAGLHLGWREMIEKITRYQLDAGRGEAAGWKTQEFDGRPEPLRAEAKDDVDAVEGANGPLTAQAFQVKFAELRKRFRDKYGRDIVLTGADHGEHRRLYGTGGAYDIRARDLNRSQVQFIISEGSRLGLRIKDFSTWDKVYAHNARTLMLGRPLDTLATGLHLHIDRMAPYKRKMVAKPASKQKQKKTPAGTDK
jgi:hypothetical protein